MTARFELPVRFSHLKAYGRSALHGYHARATETAQTISMQRGTAVHALLFNTRKVVAYQGKRDKRAAAYQDFCLLNKDAEIMTVSEFASVNAIANAVRSDPVAKRYLEGIYEETILFDWYGQKCRATPDIRGHKRVVDLKTSRTADPEAFPWESLRYKYHAQVRMQQMAAGEVDEAYLIVVESSAPYPVTVFRLTDEALSDGEKNLTLWMERLITCERSGQWPPYAGSVVPLDIPRRDDLDYLDDEPPAIAGDDATQDHNGLQP